jgi:carbohydrate diacid regulator
MLDPDARVFAVADLRVPQLVAAAARQERSEFAASVLGGLRDRADWPTLRETLIAWSEGGFNLLRAAERLHVHRNTLLYRLGKIEQLSARQMREPTQAIAMYLAALADLLDSPQGRSAPRPERPVKPARTAEDAWAIGDDKARRRLLAGCQHQT